MNLSRKIIVTGTNGNLGEQILKTSAFNFISVNRNNWDSLDQLAIGECDAVIHCAYDLKRSINLFPAEVLDSNIISTARLLKLCKEKNIKKFVFVSSCSVYGDSSNSSEEKPCQPITMNGHIKAFNEELVRTFCHANNIEYLIVRPFNSFGGNDHFSVVQKLINCAKTQSPFTLVNEGSSERDFIHVEDVAKIICILLEKNLKNEIINIGSGNPVKIIDLVNAVEKKIGKIKMTRTSNANETLYSRANIKKLKSLIDYKPIDIFDYINSEIASSRV